MKLPLVSILIPVYNCEKFIKQAIQSALDQSWENIEIIIVNDGSTDNTLSIAESFLELNKVYVYSIPKGGGCKARNFAFSKSKGEYIQYLDADDLLSKDKIFNQMQIALRTKGDCVISCSWERFSNNYDLDSIKIPQRYLDKNWDDPIDWLCESWKGKGMGQTSIWLIPRDIISKSGMWNEELIINQDGEFFSRVLLNSRSIKYSKDDIVYYRSGNNTSVSQVKNYCTASSQLLSYKLYEENILKKENSPRVKEALACNYRWFIYSYYDFYPSLIREAKIRLEKLKINKIPILAGNKFKVIAQLIGFNNTLRLRSFCKKLI